MQNYTNSITYIGLPKSVLSKNDNEWVMPSWFVQKQFAPIV